MGTGIGVREESTSGEGGTRFISRNVPTPRCRRRRRVSHYTGLESEPRYQWRGINAVMTTTLPPSQCSDEESPCWNADMCFKKLSWLIRCDSQNDELKTNVFLLNHFLFFSFIYPFHNLRFQSVKIKWHIIMRLWLSKSKQNMDAKFSVSMRKHFKNQIKNQNNSGYYLL